MNDSKLIKYFPYIFVLVLIANPYFHLMDMWDGVLIDYAEARDNFIGIHGWFYESEWHLQYWFVRGELTFAKLLGVSYFSVNLVVLGVMLCVLVREMSLVAGRIMRLDGSWKALAVFYIVTSPILINFYSSVMTFYLICWSVGLWGLRWIHEPVRSKNIVGYIAVIPALSLQSLLVFLPVLSYVYDWSRSSFKAHIWKAFTPRTVGLFALVVVFFFGYRILLPKTGLYADYNQIGINGTSGFKVLLVNVAKYFTFLGPLFCFSLFCLAVAACFTESRARIKQLILRASPRTALVLAVLFCASVFPYIAVGKSTTLSDWHEWGQRQALLLLLPMGLIVGAVVRLMYDILDARRYRVLAMTLAFIFIAVTNGAYLLRSIAERTSRQIFAQELESQIRIKANHIPPGILEIKVAGKPWPPFAPYESNYLMYRATGEANWWTNIADTYEKDFSTLFEPLKSSREYQVKYIYDYDFVHAPCHTYMNVEVTGFLGFSNQLKLALTRNTDASAVRIGEINTSCS